MSLLSWGRSFRSVLFSACTVSAQDVKTKKKESNYEEGWSRLKEMYSTNKYGESSDEVGIISNLTALSVVVGFFWGAVPATRTAFHKFMEENQSAIYHNYDHIDTKKRLWMAVAESAIRSGSRVALRLTLFTTVSITTIFSINAFVGHTTIMEFILGGSVLAAGSKWKAKPGQIMKAAVIGGCLGAGVGAIMLKSLEYSGATISSVFKDVSIDEDRVIPDTADSNNDKDDNNKDKSSDKKKNDSSS